MFEMFANKIEYNGFEENRAKNGPNWPKNHDLQETEQDLPGTPQSPIHIPSSLAHSRRNAVRHVNCLHNARSITKRLGTRQSQTNISFASNVSAQHRNVVCTRTTGFNVVQTSKVILSNKFTISHLVLSTCIM